MKIYFILFLLSLSSSALAEVNSDLQNYFTQRINQVQTAMNESSLQNSGTPVALQDINLDIAPSVSFGVSEVLSFTISPEIDFIFVPVTID